MHFGKLADRAANHFSRDGVQDLRGVVEQFSFLAKFRTVPQMGLLTAARPIHTLNRVAGCRRACIRGQRLRSKLVGMLMSRAGIGPDDYLVLEPEEAAAPYRKPTRYLTSRLSSVAMGSMRPLPTSPIA